jgi:hypothetical protein
VGSRFCAVVGEYSVFIEETSSLFLTVVSPSWFYHVKCGGAERRCLCAGMTLPKVDNARPGSIRRYENLKRKLYNCNASIYVNEQCLKRRLIPSYARIKTPNTSPAHRDTQQKIPNMRIKDEIRYLHSKKQRLHLQIYHLHLYLAHTWDNTWPYIQEILEEKLRRETRLK